MQLGLLEDDGCIGYFKSTLTWAGWAWLGDCRKQKRKWKISPYDGKRTLSRTWIWGKYPQAEVFIAISINHPWSLNHWSSMWKSLTSRQERDQGYVEPIDSDEEPEAAASWSCGALVLTSIDRILQETSVFIVIRWIEALLICWEANCFLFEDMWFRKYVWVQTWWSI